MPDLSFHEDSGSRPLSQEVRQEMSRPQESVSQQDAAIAERIFKFETLSPEHRLLLSLLPPEEQGYFAANVEPGSAETLSVLARILTRERTHRKRRSALQIGIAALLGFGDISFVQSGLAETYPALMLLGIFVGFPLLIGLALYSPVNRLERAAFDYLLSLDDSRSVGLLLEQRTTASPADRKRANAALIQRLSLVEAEDAAQWTEAQRRQIYAILEYIYRDRDIELRLAAITVLDKINDRRAIRALYPLASGEAAARGEQAVRAAAQKCLYGLQSRLDFGPVETIPTYLQRIYITVPADEATTYVVDADSLYALLALLPQLTPINYRQILTQKDRDRLYSVLAPAIVGNLHYDKVKLYREVVRTLERVGDTRSIYTLQQISIMGAPTDATRQLRAEAKTALGTLRQQLEREKVGKTLLRASSAPDTQAEELLRASAPAESTTDPAELLRASVPQQERGPITPDSLAKAMEALRRQSQKDDNL